MDIEEKKARPYWVTDTTHDLFRNVCKNEEMTTEGLLKRLLSEWILKKAKGE